MRSRQNPIVDADVLVARVKRMGTRAIATVLGAILPDMEAEQLAEVAVRINTLPADAAAALIRNLAAGKKKNPAEFARSTEVQSLLFDQRMGWLPQKAKAWAKGHKFRYGKV